MYKIQRREFLKGVCALTAAPLILPSRVWSAESAPSGVLTIGFIGLGVLNSQLSRGFLSRGRVVAVCDVDTTRRTHGKQRVDDHYGNTDCAAYTDFRDLIARDDIDVVFIATPDHWHATQTIAALRAGKDVYCEKPLTHNIQEALDVMRAAQETGRIVQTGSQQRSSQEFRVACELIRNGVIGSLTHVDCRFGGPAVPCDLPEEEIEPGLDWNMWLGPAPMRGYNSILSPRGVHGHFPAWRRYREYATGSIGDWGAHHLDIAQWAMGMDASGPVEVIPTDNPEKGYGAQLVYPNGVTVHHASPRSREEGGNGVQFFGTNGDIHVNRGEFSLTVNGEKIKDPRSDSTGATVQRAARTFLKNPKIRLQHSRNHRQNFIDSVKSRKPPVAHAEAGARTVICCHLLSQSYYHHAHLKWDPKNNEFTGGTGDPAWLRRENERDWQG